MIKPAVIATLLCTGAGTAAADPVELLGWEIDANASIALAGSPGRDDADSVDAYPFLALIHGEVRVERVLDNGAEIGVRLGGRLQLDHSARRGFSGRLGDGSVFFDGLAPRGAFTGLTLGGPQEDNNADAQLETAFVYIDGGYGELLAGRDIGIARRFHEGSPTVFRWHRISSPALDTSGIATLLTRNDLTGPAAKISYESPAILGLKVGGSYTPQANVSGLDRDPEREVVGIAEPRLEDALEAAFNVSRRLPSSGVKIDLYGAYSRAKLETGPARINEGTVEVWSTGGKLGWGRFEVGGDWLTTDNGPGRYRAWTLGGKMEALGLDWSVGYGESSDEVTGTDGESWSAGVSYVFKDKLTLTAGVQRQSLEFDNSSDSSSTGPVIEMTLRL